MTRILVTGATGNIGLEVVHFLGELSSGTEIFAAVRNIESSGGKFTNQGNLQFRQFDFENPATFTTAFHQIDILFLLRPPHISEAEKVFRPLVTAAKENGIRKVVFLSVQGAEKSKVIPHNKIEALIRELGFQYIFVRPSYFMQNLTTTLLGEIRKKGTITLPSGKAKFNWVDVKNIGEATAKLIMDFDKYQNQPYEITGSENKNFGEVANLISEVTGEDIRFRSVNPLSFYLRKKREGMEGGFAMVMTILHFLPRIQSEPEISDNYQRLTGKSPTTLREFIEREKENMSILQDLKNILFIQGGGNGGYEADKKLVNSLQSALGKGYLVHYPEIHPVEGEADYGWPEQIVREILRSKNDLILVGHSFGASMILKCLSENSIHQMLKGVFLISTPFWSGNEDWVKGLMLKDDFANQLPATLPIFFYHAKDDEEVPFSHFNSYRSKVERAHFRVIDQGGHQLNNDLSVVARDITSL